MSFRRIPFKFSSTDPVERQAELEKRFGFRSPSLKNNMYVDVANPFSMGAVEKQSSPRLQHRVPIFLDGSDQPVQSSVDSVGKNADGKKPNVRVIPIEVEGDYRPFSRHRTFSGPAGMPKNSTPDNCDYSSLKQSAEDLSQPHTVNVAGRVPKVHNIPIQIEDRILPGQKTSNMKMGQCVTNGCASSKQTAKVSKKSGSCCESSKQLQKVNPSEKQSDPSAVAEPKVENSVENSMKKIDDVLKELVSYDSGVKEFTGSTKDKQYRYLDEMLTRCMLRLDDVDTMGDESVRFARKSAVRKVQACIDLLESKVNAENVGESIESQCVDVEMEGVSECPEAESTSTDDKTEAGEVEMTDKDESCVENDTVSVTVVELGDDAEVESSLQVPDVIEPSEVEVSENQLDQGEKHSSDMSEETGVEIEEKEDSNTESADEVAEVEMTETSELSEKPTDINSTVCESNESDQQDADMGLVIEDENVVGNEHIEKLTAEQTVLMENAETGTACESLKS